MYLEHFKIKEFPFQLTPDSEYLYLGHSHARALSYMDYTTWNQEGFVVITGDVGTGKTILLKKFLEELTSNVVIAKIFQTQLDEVEFLQSVLVEFGINPFNAKKVELMDMLNTFLIESFAQGKQTVLLVDDAQNLNKRVLEEIRMLSCLETNKEKMVHVILLGQPELNYTLESPELEQLLQRVRLRIRLMVFNDSETSKYIHHRLKVGGAPKKEIFKPDSIKLIYKYTGGNPRLINSLCDTCMACAYADEKDFIDGSVVKDAAAELAWVPFNERKKRSQSTEVQTLRKPISDHHDYDSEVVSILKKSLNELSTINDKLSDVNNIKFALNVITKKISEIEKLLLKNINEKGKRDNANKVTYVNKKQKTK